MKKRNLLFIIMLIIISLSTTCLAEEYTWEEIKNKDDFVLYIGQYQDYWVDWSPDSNKLTALFINQDIGIHILDLTKIYFKENEHGIMVPTRLVQEGEIPYTWYAPVITKPNRQGSPTWSGEDNIVAYIEFSEDYQNSTLKIYDIDKNELRDKKFSNINKIDGLDFAWNNSLLAIYSDKILIIWDYKENKVVKKWNALKEITQVSWFPNDKEILVIYDKQGYKFQIESDSTPELFIENARFGNCAFVPNSNKIIMGSEKGLVLLDYETGNKRLVTNGFDYQPKVSPDGRFVSYISETPFGAFVIPIN